MVRHNLNSPLPCLTSLSNNGRFRPLESDPVLAIRSAQIVASSRITLAEFVGIKFLPEYIEQKSFAGRRHYQAMLKHILLPETVDQLFNSGSTQQKSRLKAVPAWPYLDKVKLCELQEHHVRDLTVAAVAQGYSAQTVKHIRNALGVIIAHAKRERLFVTFRQGCVTGFRLPC